VVSAATDVGARSDHGGWFAVAAGAVVAAAGAAFAVVRSRGEDPGRAAFNRVLREGVHDGGVHYVREGLESMWAEHRLFDEARRAGYSPNEVASLRRPGEPPAVRLVVDASGAVHLVAGRERYLAAKEAGATAARATVALLDARGDAADEREAVVRLV
jgi:hypothetical protein